MSLLLCFLRPALFVSGAVAPFVALLAFARFFDWIGGVLEDRLYNSQLLQKYCEALEDISRTVGRGETDSPYVTLEYIRDVALAVLEE